MEEKKKSCGREKKQDKQITILDADSSLGQNKNATNAEIKCINGTNCIKYFL